ncbi:MAG: serine protease, partial [Chloroflexi bacterium]|nr:serine protease [Chloroflexota bacterium]
MTSRFVWVFFAAAISLTVIATLTKTVLADDPEPQPEPQIVSTKIVGGSIAQVGAWPWQVALLSDGSTPESGQFCGGSLITDEWVVTAAHCMFDTSGALKQPSEIDVQAGIHALSSNAGQRRDVSSIVVHPSYNPTTFDNDIALVKLSSPVTLDSTVSTIVPLTPEDGSLANPGVTATVTGWGTTSSGGLFSDDLRQVEVPIVSTSDCNSSASYNGAITANMLCAGSIEDGGIDSCQGDSGGPLVVPDGAGWRLAGVVSWGTGCALPQKPGVYTRVSEMRDFISQNTGVFSTDISLIKSVTPVDGQSGG